MIYSLSGKIIKKTLNAVVVSCGGVGYYVQCPTSVAGALPGVGREATLYTVMSVTENDISLYGFATEEQQSCFELLTAVSGVGPKVGLAILSVMEPDRVRELLQLAQDPISLETPVGEEEDAHLEDFIQDEEAGVPVDEAGRELLRRELANVLKSLTPREERVLTLRFGLEDGQARTLEELGKEFNVTRERIRQIEAKALRKLRHPSRAKRLRDYLEE